MRSLSVLLTLIATAAAISASAQEKIQFASLDGRNSAAHTLIDGYLFRPTGRGPYPALVFLHGCGGLLSPSGSIAPREIDWQSRLTAAGYVVLMVDSFTTRRSGEICSPASFKAWLHMRRPADAYGALVHLQGLPFVARDRIGLMGWSNGGDATLMAVAKLSLGRPAAFAEPDFRAAVAFYPGSCNENRQAANWTTSIPLLILVGESDVWTPFAPCKILVDQAVARGAPIELHGYPGAYHDFDWPNLKRRELPAFATRDGVVPIVGEDPAAHADAVQRVETFFSRHLLH
jgi:dienelactone hydrolase